MMRAVRVAVGLDHFARPAAAHRRGVVVEDEVALLVVGVMARAALLAEDRQDVLFIGDLLTGRLGVLGERRANAHGTTDK